MTRGAVLQQRRPVFLILAQIIKDPHSLSALDTTLIITISAFTLQGGKKNQQDFHIHSVFKLQLSCPFVVVPFALPKLLSSLTQSSTSLNHKICNSTSAHMRYRGKAHQPSSSTFLFILTETKYYLIWNHRDESKLLHMLVPFLGRNNRQHPCNWTALLCNHYVSGSKGKCKDRLI